MAWHVKQHILITMTVDVMNAAHSGVMAKQSGKPLSHMKGNLLLVVTLNWIFEERMLLLTVMPSLQLKMNFMTSASTALLQHHVTCVMPMGSTLMFLLMWKLPTKAFPASVSASTTLCLCKKLLRANNARYTRMVMLSLVALRNASYAKVVLLTQQPLSLLVNYPWHCIGHEL